jgi:uncharacterized lipoprotein YajG
MSRLAILLLTSMSLGLAGCAFTPATLDLGVSSEVHVAGPLGDVSPLRFSPPQLEDARLDRTRIGHKKNGYGENTADISSAQPVAQVVETAVAKALVDGRHSVVTDGDIRVSGTVNRFWFEFDSNFWSVGFIGDVRCSLEFIDASTGRLIHKADYSGSYAMQKATGGLEKTWTVVLNKALERLVEAIVLDDELAAALKERAQPTGPSL